MSIVSFNALGLPAPGGSKKAFRHRHTGKIVVVDAGGKRTKAWRSIVAAAAREAMADLQMIEPPLMLCIEFRMPRPKSHLDREGKLRAGAPWVPMVAPDLTKLLRSTEDAMTGIVYRDDALIVEQHIHKAYALDEYTGARITVCTIRSKHAEDKDDAAYREHYADTPSLKDSDALDRAARARVAGKARASKHCVHQGRSRRV
jgi:Holliday junction resolvase RusA-like endonuclease